MATGSGTEIGKIGLQGGVRLEQAFTTFDLKTTDEAFDNDYFSLFPSAFATYRITDNDIVRASYSRRIDRVRTRFLNPFPRYDDPLNLSVGNPALQRPAQRLQRSGAVT